MPRPKSDSLSYFPLDVNIFSNTRIKCVRANYGAEGVTLYLFCLCEIYRAGYFIAVDDDFIDCTALDLGMTSDRVREIIGYFCGHGLFSAELYAGLSVLTSAGVQSRYQEVHKSARREFIVDGDKWLLDKELTADFIVLRTPEGIVRKDRDNSRNNEDNSRNNEDKSRNNGGKESKGKETKEEESIPQAAEPVEKPSADSRFAQAHTTQYTREDLVKRYGESAVAEYEERFRQWNAARGLTTGVNYPTIARWMAQDGISGASHARSAVTECCQGGFPSSINMDDYMSAVMRKYSGI